MRAISLIAYRVNAAICFNVWSVVFVGNVWFPSISETNVAVPRFARIVVRSFPSVYAYLRVKPVLPLTN